MMRVLSFNLRREANPLATKICSLRAVCHHTTVALVKRAIFPGIFPGSEQTSCPSRPDVTHYQSTYPWFESSVHPKRETHEASLPYHTRASRANAEPDCLLARELVPPA